METSRTGTVTGGFGGFGFADAGPATMARPVAATMPATAIRVNDREVITIEVRDVTPA